MNKPDDAVKEITEKFTNSMERTFIHSFTSGNIFKKMEAEKKIKFMKTTVIIPWYLKLFSKAITNIAYSSFKDGLSENCADTVTFKRPAEYKPNE